MTKMDKDKCDIMEEAMRQIGWAPGAEIPMANDENLRLLEELRDLMVKKTELNDELEDTNSVLDKLRRHCRKTEDSINSNMVLIQAHNKEESDERNEMLVTEHQISKLRQEIRDADKDIDNYKKYVASSEKELCKRKKDIDKHTEKIQWAKTALLEWREAVAQGQRGFDLIQKYAKEDDIRARQQDKRRQALLAEIAKYRKELVSLYDEQKSLEQNLERTASLYRTAHVERRQMVETWKVAVQQMTQRERDIYNSETQLIELKRRAKTRTNQKQQADERLNSIIENNREVEATIEELNTENSDIKAQLQRMQDLILLKENELEALQKELQNLANLVQQQRTANRQNAKEREAKLEQLEKFGLVLKGLEKRLASMEGQNMNAQQRLQILEDLMDTEDKSQKQIVKETNRTNELIFRSQQKLTESKDEGKVLLTSNEGLRVTIQAVGKNTREIERELRRQTEVHYDLSFKCLEVERKIIKQSGGILDPEAEERNEQYLAQLEEYNAVVMKRLAATEAQNKKLDDNMRSLTACYNNDNKQLEIMSFDIKEAQVYSEGGIKRLKSETHKNQMLIVELSILKLRIKEFETEIAKCDDSVYTLEQHRADLHRTIKDRMVELKSQVDLLFLKRKHLGEERSTLRADIGERTTKIEAVRARFELTTKMLGTNEDGTLVTATQVRVETAQEKQLLLEEGNDLNQRVLKAEREVKALENTLRMFACSNNNYRRSIQSKDDVAAGDELKLLNDNFCKLVCILKEARSKMLQMERDVQKYMEEKETLDLQIESIMKQIAETTEEREKLNRELLNQVNKLSRADRDLKRLIKAVRQAGRITLEQYTLQERDLDCREIEKRNMDTLNQLSDWAENDTVIGPEIVKRILKRGLQLPRQTKASKRSKTSLKSDTSAISADSARSTASVNTVTCCQVSSSRLSVLSLEFPGGK